MGASSSGVTRSRAAASAMFPRLRVSAAWRTRNRVTTPAAASSTTKKAAVAYLSLKLAAVTCAAARDGGLKSPHGGLIPLFIRESS